jgi:DNA polymerase-3 subunit delta'
MDWSSFLGHHRQRTWFSNAVGRQHLASTFLLVGRSGIGKRTFARLIAKTLLCTTNEPAAFHPCGSCEACVQVEAGTHPDVLDVHREKNHANVTIDQLVGAKDLRMREGLCYELRMRPYSGRRKIAIVDDVDTLAAEGANSLLKTLEEPPAGSLIFLIGTSEQRQLPTIRSRSQIVRFSPLSEEDLATLILRLGWVSDRVDAMALARLANGSLDAAHQIQDASVAEFRQQLISELHRRPLDVPNLNRAIVAHLDSIAKEGQLRREQLKWVFDTAIQYYRQTMRTHLGVPLVTADAGASAAGGEHFDAERLGGLIHRTQVACEQVDRNITPALVIEAWGVDIAALARA